MPISVSHLYSGNVSIGSGSTFYVYLDEKRNDEFSEANGQQSFSKKYTLQSRDSALNLEQVHLIVVSLIKSLGLLTQFGYPLNSFNISHSTEADLDYIWDIDMDWKSNENSQPSDLNFDQYKIPYELNESFETGGGTAHITQAYDTGTSTFGETIYPVSAVDPGPSTFRGQIGWNGETAEGCDVIRPAFSFTLHKKISASEMTQTYKQNLAFMTGCVNSTAYYGFSAGNLLLESVSASTSVEYHEEDITVTSGGQIVWNYRLFYDVTYKFRGGIEFTDLPVGGVLINKKAHQYVWVYYEKVDDTAVGVTINKPKSVIVNDVYPSADFSQLNIFGELDV